MLIEIKELEGRRHFVVPTVMITVGVHHGSHGPVFYPPAALLQSVPYWNGRPVVVYHPGMYSGGWASNPEVFNRQKVGVLFGTSFDGHRLKADAWLDIDRVTRVDARVYNAIQARRMMEVSTGLVCVDNARPGTFRGKPYQVAADYVQPDHLAILPDKTGACSIADGAGLLRNRGTTQEPLPIPSFF